MKKLVVLIVVLVGLWVGVNYMRTGSLLPSALSAEEQHVRDLEREIANVNEQMAQAGANRIGASASVAIVTGKTDAKDAKTGY